MSRLCYKKLFKKLIDKLKNGDNVTTDVLVRICDVLHCDISDIVECIENNR